MSVTSPYRYLLTAASQAPADSLVEELHTWHDRMVAHVRRHGASPGACDCDVEECPRAQARDLWARARRAFGESSAQLTFLRVHAGGAHG